MHIFIQVNQKLCVNKYIRSHQQYLKIKIKN